MPGYGIYFVKLARPVGCPSLDFETTLHLSHDAT